jgi:hypothetical protein
MIIETKHQLLNTFEFVRSNNENFRVQSKHTKHSNGERMERVVG